MIYSTASLLIGPAYALAGRWGIAVLLACFHLGAGGGLCLGAASGAAPQLPPGTVADQSGGLVFSGGLDAPGRLLVPRVPSSARCITTPPISLLAPFALLAMLWFYRAWHSLQTGKLNLRVWAVYTLLLTVATSFKASLVFAFAPALLLLLIADLVRSRGSRIGREVVMGCSVLPSIALCLVQANVLFAEADQRMHLIFYRGL